MHVHVEFYGIPRLRAGCGSTRIEADGREIPIGDVLGKLQQWFPEFAASCLDDDARTLQSGYILSINGQSFVSDPNEPLHDGDCLLILSADMGG